MPCSDFLLVLRFGQAPAGLLHFLREQRRAVNLDDLQRAARGVQVLGRARQRVRAGTTVDVVLELAARRIQRARELPIHQLEGVRR